MKRAFYGAMMLAIAWVGTAKASDPVGIYARVDRVSMGRTRKRRSGSKSGGPSPWQPGEAIRTRRPSAATCISKSPRARKNSAAPSGLISNAWPERDKSSPSETATEPSWPSGRFPYKRLRALRPIHRRLPIGSPIWTAINLPFAKRRRGSWRNRRICSAALRKALENHPSPKPASD